MDGFAVGLRLGVQNSVVACVCVCVAVVFVSACGTNWPSMASTGHESHFGQCMHASCIASAGPDCARNAPMLCFACLGAVHHPLESSFTWELVIVCDLRHEPAHTRSHTHARTHGQTNMHLCEHTNEHTHASNANKHTLSALIGNAGVQLGVVQAVLVQGLGWPGRSQAVVSMWLQRLRSVWLRQQSWVRADRCQPRLRTLHTPSA